MLAELLKLRILVGSKEIMGRGQGHVLVGLQGTFGSFWRCSGSKLNPDPQILALRTPSPLTYARSELSE